MASNDFLLPDLGEGLTEATVVTWLVAVGDTVTVDQPVAEVETAKAVVEVPTPFAGTVEKLFAAEGEEVKVGTPLVTVGDGTGGTVAEPVAPAAVENTVPVEDEGSGNVLVGYGTSGGSGKRRRRTHLAPPAATAKPVSVPPVPAAPAVSKPNVQAIPRTTPPVRKLAKELGVDLATVTGTGNHGRITREDVRAVVAGTSPGTATTLTTSTVSAGGDRREKMSAIRRTIAAQMQVSRREIPEAVTWMECDAQELWDLRKALATKYNSDTMRISTLALQLRMIAAGLRKFPMLNASLDTTTDEIIYHHDIHLGVAVQTDRGLVVPVLRDVHQKSVLDIAEDLTQLADVARKGRLSPDQMVGSTFSISNYGAFGVDGGDMVINHPNVAILGTGRIHDRPWVVDGEVKVRKVTTYSIAFDHRVCDGGEATGFLRFIADATTDPNLLLASL